MKKNIPVILSFIYVFTLYSCDKEYSYEGVPAAKYTVQGSPGACAGISIGGAYISTRPLDTTNKIDVALHVTLPGHYYLATANINGITFAATGDIVDTGMARISIRGYGTPLSTGSFTYRLSGVDSCSFTISVTSLQPAEYSLSGTPNKCSDAVANGNYYSGQKITSGNTLSVSVLVTKTGTYTISTNEVSGIQFTASGYFASTGPQRVTLTGSGTIGPAGYPFFKLTGNSTTCDIGLIILPTGLLATYVLTSGSNTINSCAPQIVAGDYKKGIITKPLNNASIGAFATVAGDYVVSTDQVNGLQFSAAGTFATDGNQTILLLCNGTPKDTGNFVYTPTIIGPAPLGGATCGFIIHVQ